MSRLLSILFFLIISSNANAQTVLEWSSGEQEVNIDYHSFFPQLMLKHQIGPFYKLPKNPVFKPKGNGWESADVADPHVVVTADSVHLYYSASGDGHYSIGQATMDPDHWVWQNRRQILHSDTVSWRAFHLISPTLMPKENLLVYNGNSSDAPLGYKIGLAKSNSGAYHFISQHALSISANNKWDFSGQAYQDILYFPKQKTYKMWYSGFNGPFSKIGLTTSTNGLDWEKSHTVLNINPGVIAPKVIFNGSHYTMFYAQLNLSRGLATEIWRADSPNGINWQNSQLVFKAERRWEGQRLMRPSIAFFNQKVHLFYCAQRGSVWRIGAALADAMFKPTGKWRSAKLNPIKSAEIAYEAPEGTSLEVVVLGADFKPIKSIILSDLSNRRRTGVSSQIIDLSEIKSAFYLQLNFTSDKGEATPVVYQLLLHD